MSTTTAVSAKTYPQVCGTIVNDHLKAVELANSTGIEPRRFSDRRNGTRWMFLSKRPVDGFAPAGKNRSLPGRGEVIAGASGQWISGPRVFGWKFCDHIKVVAEELSVTSDNGERTPTVLFTIIEHSSRTAMLPQTVVKRAEISGIPQKYWGACHAATAKIQVVRKFQGNPLIDTMVEARDAAMRRQEEQSTAPRGATTIHVNAQTHPKSLGEQVTTRAQLRAEYVRMLDDIDSPEGLDATRVAGIQAELKATGVRKPTRYLYHARRQWRRGQRSSTELPVPVPVPKALRGNITAFRKMRKAEVADALTSVGVDVAGFKTKDEMLRKVHDLLAAAK